MEEFLNAVLGPDQRRNRSLRRAANNFQTQAAQFMNEAMDPTNAHAAPNNRVPPASAKALRQLPVVQVTPQDLVEESNRECCICLEDHKIGERVIRLPCAHIFHPECARDWLKRHCTCPVCRFELETDNPRYEQGRLQRMKKRKPRFARHELERMPEGDLEELCKQLQVRKGSSLLRKNRKRSDYIESLERSGKIHIIEAPPPVEYKLDFLNGLSIKKLKQTMADAGVFFDPKDVVEKSDMISLFVNSGRLVLTEGDDSATRSTSTIFNYDFERKEQKPLKVEPNLLQEGNAAIPLPSEPTTELLHDEEEKMAIPQPSEPTPEPLHEEDLEETQHEGTNSILVETVTDEEFTDEPDELHASAINMFENLGEALAQLRQEESEQQAACIAESELEDETMDVDMVESEPVEQFPPPSAPIDPRVAFQSKSVSELKSIASRNEIQLPPGCLERGEIVDILVSAGASAHLQPHDFDGWSVSQLRAAASEVRVDLSQSSCKDDMVDWLVVQARQHPHISKYLSALMPLVNLSNSQLRAVARELRVDVSKCVEKEHMIHLLIQAQAGAQRSTTN